MAKRRRKHGDDAARKHDAERQLPLFGARRIQQRRARGWRKPAGAVAVSRGTKWGNPYPVERKSDPQAHAAAVALYRQYLARTPALVADARRELRGRDLMCWCPLTLPCHADVLLEVANAP